MSESIRDLVVSLSLNTDNFTRNIKSVNKQIQEAESYFKLASAGIDGFDSSAAGLSAKLEMLERKLSLQRDAVEQYQRALTQASAKLTECYNRQEDYSNRLAQAKDKQEDLRMAVEEARIQYEDYKATLGETDSVTIAAKQNLEAAEQEYQDATADVEQLAGQCDALQRSTQNAADAVSTAQTQLNKAEAAVRETEAAIKETTAALKTAQSSWTSAGETLTAFGKKCTEAGRNLSKVGKSMTRYISTPIIALGAASIKAGLDFESSFASVRKTVDATEEEFEQLAAASKRMSTEVAASTTTINEVMATGGQLGIATEHMEEFTRVMIDLSNSCEDLSADEAATSIAKFANIMGTDQSQFQNIGSTIVDLGNNFATTEKPIMEMAQRLAGAGRQVGMSEADILGFAAALSSVGIEAQMGGSSFSKAMVKMEVATVQGGQALDDFASVAGMSSAQFKAMWDTNPADAFMAFIVGLSQMDEEGISAIATLNDIGISEIRLRDTLLRATNATDLFQNALDMANSAWQENTALTTEANKRYATTESKLTNLKNRVVLLGQRIADDLAPTIERIMDFVGGILDKLESLDASEREQIIKFAAIAAAAGPAINALGKMLSAVGKVSGGIGKFATAVGKAGGGFSGFMKTIGSSPAIWIALAAAIVVAAGALVDWLSGARATRKAIEDMNNTAKDWSQKGVKTIYDTGTTDVLARFGISKESFTGGIQSAKTWINALISTWTDGKKETDEIVTSYVDSFKAASDTVREGIEQRRYALESSGMLTPEAQAQLDADLALLDSYDAEIASLLKKRQNGYLTEADQARLNEIIELRAVLNVTYVGTDEDAYAKIIEGIENEKARAAAYNESVSIDVYADAMSAAALGQSAYLEALNAEYDTRRQSLLLIQDEAERTEALAQLDAWYAKQRQDGAEAYRETISQIGAEAYENDGLQESVADIGELYEIMANYDGSFDSIQAVQNWMNNMDADGLASVLAVMTQLADAGIGEDVLGFDPTGILAQWQTISDIASAYPTQLEGLNSLINETISDEVHEVMVQLNLENAADQWEAFTNGASVFTSTPSLEDVPESITIDATVPVTLTDVPTELTIQSTSPVTVTGLPEGPLVIPADTPVTLTDVPPGITIQADAPVTLTGVPGDITVNGKVALNPLDQKRVTLWKALPQNRVSLEGEVNTLVGLAFGDDWDTDLKTLWEQEKLKLYGANGLPIEITPQVLSSLTAEDIVVGIDEDGTYHIIVKPIWENATKKDVDKAVEEMNNGKTNNGVFGTSFLSSSATEAMQWAQGYYENRAKEPFTPLFVKWGWMTDENLQYADNAITPEIAEEIASSVTMIVSAIQNGEALDDNALAFLDEVIETLEYINKYGMNEDLVTGIVSNLASIGINLKATDLPDFLRNVGEVTNATNVANESMSLACQETSRYIRLAKEATDENKVYHNLSWAKINLAYAQAIEAGVPVEKAQELMASASSYHDIINKLYAATDKVAGSHVDVEELNSDIAWLNAYCDAYYKVMQLMSNGDPRVTQSTLDNLDQMFIDGDFSGIAQTFSDLGIDVGTDLGAGIGDGFASYDYTSDANESAAVIETALRNAYETHSPSKMTEPIGEDVAAGIGSGMKLYDPESDASAVALKVKSSLQEKLSALSMQTIGLNAMRGITLGIQAGRSMVIAAMRSAAKSAVKAAKEELDIHSPSRVFRDEVGSMAMKGFGEGIFRETENQAKIIRNASRYLTDEAINGSIVGKTNNKTYNSTNTISFAGSSFYIRDEQDVYSLAVEIASLTKRQQRGKGMRFA